MEKEINSETLAHACQHDVSTKTAVYIRTSCATCYNLSQLQDGPHCAYSVTLERVRATIVAVEKLQVLHNLSMCVCSCSYSACNTHAQYCHLWPVRLYKGFDIIS